MKIAELREMNSVDLIELDLKLGKELFQYREKLSLVRLDQTHLIAKTRKLRAQVLTVLNEKKGSVS